MHDLIVAAVLLFGLSGLAAMLGRKQDNDAMCPNDGGC